MVSDTPANRAHRFDSLSAYCVGCDIARREIAEAKTPPPCPAIQREVDDAGAKVVMILRPDEKLIVWREFGAIRLGTVAMFELRDFIDEGVRALRGD